MADYVIQIGDENGVSFKVVVTITTTLAGFSGNGTWRSKDKGYISHTSGEVKRQKSSGTQTTKHIYLYSPEGKWGIRLNDFHDWLGANDQGSGVLEQTWALAITPGRISWALVK